MPLNKNNNYWDLLEDGNFEGGQFQVILIKNKYGQISYSILDDGEVVTKGIKDKDDAINYVKYILYDREDKENEGDFNISFSDWKRKVNKKSNIILEGAFKEIDDLYSDDESSFDNLDKTEDSTPKKIYFSELDLSRGVSLYTLNKEVDISNKKGFLDDVIEELIIEEVGEEAYEEFGECELVEEGVYTFALDEPFYIYSVEKIKVEDLENYVDLDMSELIDERS